MPLFKKCDDFTTAKELIAKGIYPYFHELQSRQDVEVMMEGKRRIMLGSNNYLGLTVHPEVVEAGIKALEKYGTGCSGSRFLNGTLDMHLQLEHEIAEFLGKEAAVTFPTGFQTNLGIISTIAGRHEYILCDRENHASIYDGCRLSYAETLRYRHSDMADLERQLERLPYDAGKLIITDGIFSMGGDICKLPEIVALAEKYQARVMVDDAHSFGVIGNGGRGTADYFGLTDKVDIIMGTFSKSLASLGGFMATSERVAHYVRHTSRPFIFAASIPPANCATALAALNVIRNHPEIVTRLSDLARYMRNALKERHVPIIESTTPIIPIYTYQPEPTLVTTMRLFEEGVYVNSVLPPACAPNECLMRTSLMASHTEALIDEAAEIIQRVMDEQGLLK